MNGQYQRKWWVHKQRVKLTWAVFLLVVIVILGFWFVWRETHREPFTAPAIYNGVRMSGAEWRKLYRTMDQAEKETLNYAVDGTLCFYNKEVKRTVCDLLVQSDAYMEEHGYDLAPGLSSKQVR